MIPGANLLKIAMGPIARQSFSYYRFEGRSVDAIGKRTNTYAPAVPLTGSVQPVPRTLFERLGLDFSRNYIRIWAESDFVGIERDYSGDMVRWNGMWFQLETRTNWFQQDGWQEYLLVQVFDAPDIVGPYYD